MIGMVRRDDYSDCGLIVPWDTHGTMPTKSGMIYNTTQLWYAVAKLDFIVVYDRCLLWLV